MGAVFRWLWDNLSTLALAFFIAVAVWVSAVVTADPNEERTFTRTLTVIGQDSKLMLVNTLPAQARVTLNAPRSLLSRLTNNPNLIQVWVDLSGLEAGEHTVPLKVKWDINPVRLTRVDPLETQVVLEQLVSKTFPVQLMVMGEPPLGYKKGAAEYTPEQVTVSGPASQVAKVSEVRAALAISGASETLKSVVTAQALQENGDSVADVTLTPKMIQITQPINLLGGYKNVVVKVITDGQLADGYRLTNISVTPPNVTIFSADPQLINDIPGYAETMPIDLSHLNDDLDMRVALNLPKGVALVGEQSVLVQVGVAAVEGSMTVSLPVETLGLPPQLQAHISPATIDVIVSGPLPVLDTLTPASFRAVIDLSGAEPGVYQVAPKVDLAPEQVKVQTVMPEDLEVVIDTAPTAAPTAKSSSLNPAHITQTPKPVLPTPMPTLTPVLTPTLPPINTGSTTGAPSP